MKKKLFNFKGGYIKATWNEADASPVEVMVYDNIGEDPWSMGGITAEDFRNCLNAIPKDRELHLRVNSKGGDVHEGIAMRNALMEWPKKITTSYDGIAASVASWAFAPNRDGDEVRAYRSSQMFVHDAISFGFGNAEDFRKAADDLDKTSDQIAQMYADKTGKGKRTMRDLMRDETLLTGEEAEEMGLVDKLVDGKAIRNFKPAEFAAMQAQLKAFNSAVKAGQTTNQTPPDHMKKRMIALLNKHGVKEVGGIAISNEMTDEQIAKVNDEQLEAAYTQLLSQAQREAATAPRNQDFIALQEKVNQLTELNKENLKNRVTNEVKSFVTDDKLEANLEERVINMALKFSNDADREEYLGQFRNRQPNRPGGAPLRTSVECVSEAFDDIQNYVIDNGPKFFKQMLNIKRDTGRVLEKNELQEMHARSLLVANTIAKHKEKIIAHWNLNAIDSALQRQVILQDMIRAYAIILLPLSQFSTVYSNIPLEGTDKVEVPYFPLQTTASTSFVKGTGYTTSSDWTENSREIAVGGDGSTAAAANQARDRKYQMINFDSYDLRRQPYLNLVQLFVMAAQKLAVDVFTDIVKSVVTAANFGASVKAVAAAAFSADDVADLDASATGRNWPQAGRSMALDHLYYAPLLKDQSFKAYLSYGNADAIQTGRIKSAYSFENIDKVPNLAANYSPAGENLVGWITHKSAVLAAFANIMPSPAVRILNEIFEIVTDEQTGISFAHRRFGDAVKDRTFEVAESSYGAGKGVDAALGRITSQ